MAEEKEGIRSSPIVYAWRRRVDGGGETSGSSEEVS